jgi:phosphatidate cytidylyltransferase
MFPNGLVLTFFIIIVAVISDISGYFGGQFFGKKKIFPYISPNKTLEGTFFALFMPSVIILPIMILANLKLEIYLAFSMIIFMSAGAVFGDLGASLIKRNFGVKNSSNILPGHGGVIDRLDSIIGSSLVLIIMILMFHIIGIDSIQLIGFEK